MNRAWETPFEATRPSGMALSPGAGWGAARVGIMFAWAGLACGGLACGGLACGGLACGASRVAAIERALPPMSPALASAPRSKRPTNALRSRVPEAEPRCCLRATRAVTTTRSSRDAMWPFPRDPFLGGQCPAGLPTPSCEEDPRQLHCIEDRLSRSGLDGWPEAQQAALVLTEFCGGVPHARGGAAGPGGRD
jgi:hypothetical protein